MKIVTVIYSDFRGGAVEHRARMMMKGLALAGNEVHILCPRRSEPGPLHDVIDGVHLHWGTQPKPLKRIGLFDKIARRVIVVKMLLKLLREGLDWIILKNYNLEAVFQGALVRRYNCRVALDVVEVPHILTPSLFQRLVLFIDSKTESYIARTADLNIVISTFLRKRLHKFAPNSASFLFPAVVDSNLFKYDSKVSDTFRQKYNMDMKPVVSYLGSFFYAEGVDIMLKALKNLLDSGRKFRILIAGRYNPQRKNVINVPKLVKELGMEESVIQTGHLQTSDVVAAMSASDILVIPKINHYFNVSGFPQKSAEYLSMNKAVVSTNFGDIPLYLKDGDNALLCETDSVTSLENAIGVLLDDKELRRKLGDNARKTVGKYFDCEVLGRQLDEEFSKILGN